MRQKFSLNELKTIVKNLVKEEMGGDDFNNEDSGRDVLYIRRHGAYYAHVTKHNGYYMTHGAIGDGNKFADFFEVYKVLWDDDVLPSEVYFE